MKPLNVRIREIRKSRGISQTHMSKVLGYKSVSSYNDYELGRKKNITVEQAQIIARELGLTLDELFHDDKMRELRTSEDESEPVTA